MAEKYVVMTRFDEESKEIRSRIENMLKPLGYQEDSRHPDTVFVVGGDGTFLYAVHMYLDQLDHVRFYGIHTGTLGFYTDYKSDEFDAFMECFLQKKYHESVYPLLEAKTSNAVYYGMNEVRIENAARTQQMEVRLNGELFEDYRGTGLCISTQLGTSAYNRSLGGAVAEEGLPIIEMTEISGIHHTKYRSFGAPLVMRMSTRVDLHADDFAGALLGADSDVYYIDNEHDVSICISQEKKVRMLRGRNVSYFERIQSLF